MAFAAIGASELLIVEPRHSRARQLLADTIVASGPIGDDPSWPTGQIRVPEFVPTHIPDSVRRVLVDIALTSEEGGPPLEP